MKELPYASLPFSLDGSNALVHRLGASNGFSSDVLMISGVRNQQDVMRGEETQVIGLGAIDDKQYTADDVTCIFPGTHSKHIEIVQGKVVDFKTYITGELFHVMSQYSILKDSVIGSSQQILTDVDRDAFCHGVKESGTCDLLQTLFTVRISQLFEHLTKEENYFYLSGLLIGTELRSLHAKKSRILLCSGSNIFHLYKFAIQELGLLDQTIFIDPASMDRVAIEGQIKIFENCVV
jgi:2-dehydro-3-deoxygalactonokinase